MRKMSVSDFVKSEMIQYSAYDNYRSIPYIIDGLKVSQRKAVFFFLEKAKDEKIKVAQAAASTSFHTHYQHGEDSLAGTIAGMAQSFPGTNNVPILEAHGQFGSRLNKQTAAYRYIFTKPSIHMKRLFIRDDIEITQRQYSEGNEFGDRIEPFCYYPLIPLWILNGTEGIGSGHASNILPRKLENVVKLVKSLVKGNQPTQKTIDTLLTPHFNDWRGVVVPAEPGGVSWELSGTFERKNTTTLVVNELPISVDDIKYKTTLIDLLDSKDISDYDNNSCEEYFKYTVVSTREWMKQSDTVLMRKLKLIKRVTENVTLWSPEGKLKRYENVYDALCEFVNARLTVYTVRKEHLLKKYNEDLSYTENKIRFLNYWNTKLKNTHNKPLDEVKTELVDKGGIDVKYINNFMSISVSSLTKTSVDELRNKMDMLAKTIDELTHKTEVDLYTTDLNEICK